LTDTITNFNVNVYPNLPAKNYNPIVPASTTGIISKNSDNFTISKFQSTNCGIVMGSNSLLLGCGGTSTTPSQCINFDGTNGITLESTNGLNLNTQVNMNSNSLINLNTVVGSGNSNITLDPNGKQVVIKGILNMNNYNISSGNIIQGISLQSTGASYISRPNNTTNNGLVLASSSTNAYIDFFSTGTVVTANNQVANGRILCMEGSTATSYTGQMLYYGSSHNFTNTQLINVPSITNTAGNITIEPNDTLTIKGTLDMGGNNIINVPSITASSLISVPEITTTTITSSSSGNITIEPNDTLTIKGTLDMDGNNIINIPSITASSISVPEITTTTINALEGNITIEPNDTLAIKGTVDMGGNNIINVQSITASSSISVPEITTTTITSSTGNITIDPNDTLTIKGTLDMGGNNITNIQSLSGIENMTINPNMELIINGYLQTSNACYLSKSNTANYQLTLATGTSAAYIDFHSSGASSNGKPDGRILCSGGSTAANYQGEMLYYGSKHNFNNAPLINIHSISNTGNITIDPSNTLTIMGALDMCGNEIINSSLITTTDLSTSSITTSAINSSGLISITPGESNSIEMMGTLDLKENNLINVPLITNNGNILVTPGLGSNVMLNGTLNLNSYNINNVNTLSSASVETTSISASLIESDGNISITPGTGNEVIIYGSLNAQTTTTPAIYATGDLTLSPTASVIINGDLNMNNTDINGVSTLTSTSITTTNLLTTSINGPVSENIIVNNTLDMNGNNIINLGNIELDYSNINISDISVNTISSTGNITIDPSDILIVNGTLDMSMNSINNVVAMVGTGTKNITINPNGHQLVIQNSLGADLDFGGNKINDVTTINPTSNELLINGQLNLKTNLVMEAQSSSNSSMIQCMNQTLNLNIGQSGGLGGTLSVAGYISAVNTISTQQHLTAGQNISANGNLQIDGNSSLCYSSTTNKQLFVSSNSTNGTYIDFHSSALSGVTVPDGRISCTGGTTTNYGGTLNYYGATHNFNNAPLTNLTTLSGTGNITINPINTLSINGTLDMGNNSIINIGSLQTNYTDISVNEITSTGNITIDPSNTLTINGETIINTTYSTSSTPSLRLVNTYNSVTKTLNIVPNTAPGNWNPITQSGDMTIVSVNSPLVLTTNQSTYAGVRITTDQVLIGAGGTPSTSITPTTNITIDGSNNVININGDVSLNGIITTDLLITNGLSTYLNQPYFKIQYGTTSTVNTTITIYFDIPFAFSPTVIANGNKNSSNAPIIYVRDVSTTYVTLYAKSDAGNDYGDLKIMWLAIGVY